MEPAAFIMPRSSGSSARLTDASVKNENGRRCRSFHSAIAGSNCLTFFLFPMKLSSTRNTDPPLVTMQLLQLSNHLSRGLRPGLAPVYLDDVAELAVERAPA